MGFSKSLRARCLALLVALSMLGATGGCKDDPWQLWQSYSARFIDPESGRVFDPTGDQRTTSEGQAYALFFALVANDRTTFDRVLDWTQLNLAHGDLAAHLPAWLWGRNKAGQWKILDGNSASDADTWIAYSLLEAGRLWNVPADTNLGKAMLALIAEKEVVDLPGFGLMLLPGAAGFQHGNAWILNPSYLPVFLFERFAAVDPSGPWPQIALNIPRLLEQSARHGYAMDWAEYVPGDGFYPATNPSNAERTTPLENQPCGSYDAIRVYLWAGMLSREDPARKKMLNAIPAMGVYLGGHEAPPERVDQDGIAVPKNGPVGFSAAVLPYLRAFPDLSRPAAQQMIRLDVEKDALTGLYGKDKAYYDQSLSLFATGFLDARFRYGPAGELHVKWKR
jgi:endo-1,4-beta-D-glucanase Y